LKSAATDLSRRSAVCYETRFPQNNHLKSLVITSTQTARVNCDLHNTNSLEKDTHFVALKGKS